MKTGYTATRQRADAARRIVVALAALAAGMTAATGCSHKTAEVTGPQQIKSAMGGHYSPAVQAQAQTFAQQQQVMRDAMTRSGGKDNGLGTPVKGGQP